MIGNKSNNNNTAKMKTKINIIMVVITIIKVIITVIITILIMVTLIMVIVTIIIPNKDKIKTRFQNRKSNKRDKTSKNRKKKIIELLETLFDAHKTSQYWCINKKTATAITTISEIKYVARKEIQISLQLSHITLLDI